MVIVPAPKDTQHAKDTAAVPYQLIILFFQIFCPENTLTDDNQ